MNQSLDTKYRLQIALKNYRESIESVNQAQSELDSDYKPVLQQIQQHEESRLNFAKYNLVKFMKHMESLGRGFQTMGETATAEAEKCTFELTSFIAKNKSVAEFPTE